MAPGRGGGGGGGGGGFRPQSINYGLTYEDIETIRVTIPGITNVIPSRIVKKNIRYLDNNLSTDVVGTTVDYPVSRNYNLREGRFFTQEEVAGQKNVVVLSSEVAEALFPLTNPIGDSIRTDAIGAAGFGLDLLFITGSIHAGESPNIIADSAILQGTLRAYRSEVLAAMQERLAALAPGIAAAFGGTAQVSFGDRPYPPTINDPGMVSVVVDAASRFLPAQRIRLDAGVRTMAAEDFSEFALRVPSCYFFLGIRDEAAGIVHPHHSPRFTVSEDALPLGVDILEAAALDYLAGGALARG